MKETTKRSIIRWIHVIFALPLVAYIYGPPAETVQYLPYFRYVYVPVVVLSGLWMWKGLAVRRLFAARQGVTA
jgi:thiosulfate reductase cytochrome b subunit